MLFLQDEELLSGVWWWYCALVMKNPLSFSLLHFICPVPNPGFEREMTCRTWGQYNFETFDGLYYYFPGRCTYTLLKDCEETSQASVVVQLKKIKDDGVCSHYGFTVNLCSLQLPHLIHDLQLEQISQYVLVTQQHGFTLAWEGSSGSVYIKLSPEFVGRTCGLCGNFNADVQDDLKTSYGRIALSVTWPFCLMN
uniref:VWFD domain-containing protein n=1 Tax=Monopterus albus TaxID=43700 RepID=A0A3Q3IES3_MONAL